MLLRTDPPVTGRLSAIDAYFVAYQERAGISMHLGAEVELRGHLDRGALVAALGAMRRRWPALWSPLRAGAVGLEACAPREVEAALLDRPLPDDEFRNAMIDPFARTPLSLQWRREGDLHRLSLKVHHAVFDGEGFVVAALHLVDALAAASAKAQPPPADEHRPPRPARPSPPASLLDLPGLARYQRERDEEVRAGRHARLALCSDAPGPTSSTVAAIEGDTLDDLRRRIESSRVRAPWWVLAAWLRVLHAWNREQGRGDNPQLTLEVPVSLRGGLPDPLGSGNHLSPLVLGASADRPLGEVARGLKATFKDLLERGMHRAVPTMAAPGKYLPWPLFRRAAVTTTTTGVATSHGVVLALPHAMRPRVERLSGGRLSLVSYRCSTPVCLRMGAALTALDFPDQLLLAITHRDRAIDAAGAARLRESLLAELLAL